MSVSRKQNTTNFPENEYFLPADTHNSDDISFHRKKVDKKLTTKFSLTR